MRYVQHVGALSSQFVRPRVGVKIVVVAFAIVLGFGFMMMPPLGRPLQTVEQPPGSDPQLPH